MDTIDARRLRDAVIYEIFPRNHTVEGTLKAIIPDLPRIKALGTDIVWLMPHYPIGKVGRKGNQGSPYAIQDYRAVCPDLGTKEDFAALTEAIHANGMKCLIDLVYNHTSRDSVLLSEHPEWFLRNKQKEHMLKCEDWSDVYDLDYQHRGLWEYLSETMSQWLHLGVDGFRCDVAPLVPLAFWIYARNTLDPNRQQIWLAETVHKSFIKYLRDKGYHAYGDPEMHRAFDLTYDYDGYEYLQAYWRGNAPLQAYLQHLYVQETMYPQYALKLRFNENHDNARAANLFPRYSLLANWTAFSMLLPGAYLVYAGQEKGIAELPNLFEKNPVNWDNGNEAFSIFFERGLRWLKKIKGVCKDSDINQIADGVIQVKWIGSEQEYVLLVNVEQHIGEIPVSIQYHGENLLSGEQIDIDRSVQLSSFPILIQTR